MYSGIRAASPKSKWQGLCPAESSECTGTPPRSRRLGPMERAPSAPSRHKSQTGSQNHHDPDKMKDSRTEGWSEGEVATSPWSMHPETAIVEERIGDCETDDPEYQRKPTVDEPDRAQCSNAIGIIRELKGEVRHRGWRRHCCRATTLGTNLLPGCNRLSTSAAKHRVPPQTCADSIPSFPEFPKEPLSPSANGYAAATGFVPSAPHAGRRGGSEQRRALEARVLPLSA